MTTKYQNIQILRIIACIAVFSVHFGQRIGLPGVLRTITDFGANGVYLFFIICGFVTFFSIDNKKLKPGKYYFSRFIKLAPIYYTVILYNFILHTFILHDVPGDVYNLGWVRYFFCINIFIPSDNNFWYNISATWTIFIFMLFYLLVPLIKKWCNSLKNSIITWAFFYMLSIVNIPNLNITYTFRNIHYIMIGVVIYYVVKEKKESLFILTCTLLITCHSVFSPTINIFSLVLLFSILVVSSMKMKTQNSIISKTINKLDEYTYTVYLIHAVFIELVDIYKLYFFNAHWKYVAIIICVFGTITFSIILHELIEKPIQKKLRSLVK